ncbi:homoserine O-acetyltransferase MetX [Pseudokineococcus sp. 1T1Z-3]|uniref:homoserine O-acetyltransferase MetX n=1 Tax=Pseudokineococcus sp. 1T1Z-3 TaxID=3132745 RepID=UPI00403F502A
MPAAPGGQAAAAPAASPQPPPPASAAWRPGDPVGERRSVLVGDLVLESGAVLPGVEMAYEVWGRPDADGANVVLVCHALTGDSHVVGPAGEGHPTPGWWEGLVGPGLALDTDRWCVLAPNALGGCRGSTGPASPAPDGRPWGSRFPALTVRDQVAAEEALADALGVASFALVLGGSMGGMRALEWAVCAPDRVRRLLVLASCAEASADQIAWAAAQLAAIEGDPRYAGGDYHDAPDGLGPHHGLGVARRIAHTTYRSAQEVDARFGRRAQAGEDVARGGRFAVESYLDHHADKLVRRFDAGSYVVLTRAMNGHDVGRGRGGRTAALARVTATTLVAAVTSDRLYPVAGSEVLAADLPAAGPVRLIESGAGHDGFLVEVDAVGALVAELLDRPGGPGREGGTTRL